jgi:hypothetical protein
MNLKLKKYISHRVESQSLRNKERLFRFRGALVVCFLFLSIVYFCVFLPYIFFNRMMRHPTLEKSHCLPKNKFSATRFACTCKFHPRNPLVVLLESTPSRLLLSYLVTSALIDFRCCYFIPSVKSVSFLYICVHNLSNQTSGW